MSIFNTINRMSCIDLQETQFLFLHVFITQTELV